MGFLKFSTGSVEIANTVAKHIISSNCQIQENYEGFTHILRHFTAILAASASADWQPNPLITALL